MQSTNNGSKMSEQRSRKPLNNILPQMGYKTRLPIFSGNSTSWPATNAWCMPGGKVVFYEGILPYCQNDAGIAVVMGHEIAHAVAHHSNERMSQQALIQYGQAAATEILGHNQSDTRKAILAAAIGMGTNVGITLPFSRKHEYEADHLGLIFMAMAGYDPSEAVAFWTRMANASAGKQPEFLSTHPADEKRIAKLKAAIPEALKYKKN